MPDNQEQVKQVAQAQMEEFRRQVRFLEERNQAFLRQMGRERQVTDLSRLRGVGSPVNPSLLSRLYDRAIQVRSLLGRQPQNKSIPEEPPTVVDVVYTVSATGVIEQTELALDEDTSNG